MAPISIEERATIRVRVLHETRRSEVVNKLRAKTTPPSRVKWFHLYAMLMIPSALMPFLLIKLSSIPTDGHNPLLQNEPKFDRDAFLSKVITKEPLDRADNTIVTAYFKVDYAHTPEDYEEWMSTMLRLQDAMVIFTEPSMVDKIARFRSHALNRTVIVPMELKELPMSMLKPKKFWKNQFEIDPQQRRHESFELFWIWLSKSWFVSTTAKANLFQSDVFVWSDIGCFRNKLAKRTYTYNTMVTHREVIPSDSLLFVAHQKPSPPPSEAKYVWWTNKWDEPEYFYHSSSIIAGNGDVWFKFHKAFLETLNGLIQRDLFIGEDQTVQQCTCLHNNGLCTYIPSGQIKDNPNWALRHALHHGGTYELWKPPTQQLNPEKLSLLGPKQHLEQQQKRELRANSPPLGQEQNSNNIRGSKN